MIGHILRENRNNITTDVALTCAPEGKRKRGGPKTTWRRTVEKERNEIGWRSREEARMAAANRENRGNLSRPYVPHRREETGTGKLTLMQHFESKNLSGFSATDF